MAVPQHQQTSSLRASGGPAQARLSMKRINTIVVTPANGESGSPKRGPRLASGRISTARRARENREQNLIARDRRTLAAIQLQRTRSNVSPLYIYLYIYIYILYFD